MSVIGEWAAFVAGASVATLPETERAAQRRHVADTLVAAAAGSRTSEGRALGTLLPRATVSDAIGLQAAVIRHTEIDDIHTRSCTTPSSVTVPAALSLAREQRDFDPEQVASAIWVGTELMTRLGAAIDGARVLYRGLWPTYFTAPLAAAAIAARIWRLDEGADRARTLARVDAVGRTLRPLPGQAAGALGDPFDGGDQRPARGRGGERGRRRRSRSARRPVAARCAGPRGRSRAAHARSRRPAASMRR